MFRPLSIYIGLRYTRAKRRSHFVSFISLASMLGIALGVTVLITVLSVMNGFDDEIRNRVFEMAPQVVVRALDNKIQGWPNLLKKLEKFPGVTAVAPFVSGQGMLTHEGSVYPAVINGIQPDMERHVSELSHKLTEGSLAALKPGDYGIVLGKALANSLDLRVGDKVTLVTPEASLSPVGIIPRFKRFTVVGTFEAGKGFGYDSQLGFINLADAQTLYQMGETINGIRLKIENFYAAPRMSEEIASILPPVFYVTNWTQDYGALFNAIRLEKNMMFLMLLLIVAIAAFNLVSTLVMTVNDKRADIAILRTFGATPKTVMNIFIVQGFVVGLVGTILGIIGGIALAKNVTEVVSFIQNTFHIQLLTSNVYYVDYLPSKLIWSDVGEVCMASLVLSLLATLYPAWRAARTQPAEALRYE